MARRRRATQVAAVLALLALSAVVAAAVWDERRVAPAGAGAAAPGFALPRLDGKGRLSLSALAGRVVVLNFFASWCDPCRSEAAVLEHISEAYPSRVVVVGIATNDDAGDARAFARTHRLGYPLVVADDAVLAAYAVRGLPETVFIDADGTVSGRPVSGPLDTKLAKSRVRQALSGVSAA
jgi:cytochrome c biogenesis protein CcmG, thiol:disulfide interchange protein DsbE